MASTKTHSADGIIDSIYEILSEQMRFHTGTDDQIISHLQQILSKSEYKEAEPLINELRDIDQRQAFKTGFATGIKLVAECIKE